MVLRQTSLHRQDTAVLPGSSDKSTTLLFVLVLIEGSLYSNNSRPSHHISLITILESLLPDTFPHTRSSRKSGIPVCEKK